MSQARRRWAQMHCPSSPPASQPQKSCTTTMWPWQKQVNIPIISTTSRPAPATSSLPETVQALCRDVDVIVGAKDSSGDISEEPGLHPPDRELDRMLRKSPSRRQRRRYPDLPEEGGAGGIAGRANIWPAAVAKIYDCFKAALWRPRGRTGCSRTLSPSCSRPSSTATQHHHQDCCCLQSNHNVGKCRAPFNFPFPKRVWKLSKRSWHRERCQGPELRRARALL